LVVRHAILRESAAMEVSLMLSDESKERLRAFPLSVRVLVQNTPIFPGEDREHFIQLFLEIEHSSDQDPKTMAECLMAFEAAKLVLNLQRLEWRRVQIVDHLRPAAVLAMHIRANKEGLAEPGSIAYSMANKEARAYFTSDADRKKSEDCFLKAGYSSEAVDIETYLQAHPLIVSIERQIAVAERMLMSFLKELDFRHRRVEGIRRAAAKALARGRAPNAGASHGN
jgi:hypothetical protein